MKWIKNLILKIMAFIGKFIQPPVASGGTWLKKTVTIDHTKCGTADSTNFPMLFSGTYAYLKTVANGGSVTSNSGFDIAFFSDAGLTTMLNFERVSWDGTSGVVQFFVQVPTLSHTADTVIYLGYGNSSITTDQQNKNGTWRSEFKAVLHMEEASGNVADSTSNGHTGTATGTSSIAAKIGNGRSFVLGNSDKITLANVADFDFGTGDFSLIMWAAQNNDGGRILMSRSGTATFDAFLFGYNNVTDNQLYMSSDGANWDIASAKTFGNMTFDNTTFYRIALVRIGTSFFTYINNVQGATWTSSASLLAGTNTLSLCLGQNNYTTAKIDEFYAVKGLGFTSSWITADYNNQNSPSTFYTIT